MRTGYDRQLDSTRHVLKYRGHYENWLFTDYLQASGLYKACFEIQGGGLQELAIYRQLDSEMCVKVKET